MLYATWTTVCTMMVRKYVARVVQLKDYNESDHKSRYILLWILQCRSSLYNVTQTHKQRALVKSCFIVELWLQSSISAQTFSHHVVKTASTYNYHSLCARGCLLLCVFICTYNVNAFLTPVCVCVLYCYIPSSCFLFLCFYPLPSTTAPPLFPFSTLIHSSFLFLLHVPSLILIISTCCELLLR